MTAQNSNRIYVACHRGMVGGIHDNNTYLADFVYQNLMTQASKQLFNGLLV